MFVAVVRFRPTDRIHDDKTKHGQNVIENNDTDLIELLEMTASFNYRTGIILTNLYYITNLMR